ncbi:MAG TPA: MBL fold metallo-hydrolase [Clostridia bacterium]|nr:MBL fold metallo-hydrolase [Clostridia bacterium]
MYELIRAGERSFYVDCPAKIGVYVRANGSAVLVDSGFDKEVGRKLLKMLEANGWTLAAIVATHSHADHIGGSALLQERTGCSIYASSVEAAFLRHPILEPSYLYGGYPPAELRHKFFLAQPSEALDASTPGFPEELELIPLPGHTFGMVGVRTPDDVFYLADCVSGPVTLEKYGLPFLYDVGAYLATLDLVESMRASLFVPAHAPVMEDIAPLVRCSRERVLNIMEKLLTICETPLCFDVILQRVFYEYRLKMDFGQHALIGSTVRSFLSYLKETGNMEVLFEDNVMLWRTLKR